jgi:hypothetical protein
LLQVDEGLDPRLTCLLFSKWAANNQLSKKADDALALQSMMSGQVATATLPARAMSMPNQVLPAARPLQSAFQSCANEMWPEDDDLPSSSSLPENTSQPRAAAKAVKRAESAPTSKTSKKWEEVREKR